MRKIFVLTMGSVNVLRLLLASYRGRMVPCQGVMFYYEPMLSPTSGTLRFFAQITGFHRLVLLPS